MSFWSYRPYVSVAERRAQAAREVDKLKEKGRDLAPVLIHGRKIAQNFWGKAWCDNLERYSDYEYRLPRGRSYVRNGSVIDLKIERGRVRALVVGSEVYEVEIKIAVAAPSRWTAICDDCAGSVGSLIELLRGRISDRVMERVCREGDGLFPAPSELDMSCSCPDWADMCKHVAAVLYGVGAHLDVSPELLFALRGVDHAQLIQERGDLRVIQTGATSKRILAEDDVAALFGIDLAPVPPVPRPESPKMKSRRPADRKLKEPKKNSLKKPRESAAGTIKAGPSAAKKGSIAGGKAPVGENSVPVAKAPRGRPRASMDGTHPLSKRVRLASRRPQRRPASAAKDQ